ncbi:MAG: ABC transporter permease [Planctomycetes bacterium]|nr:ABC transporter permease [Planctomycetota bacterium]
MSRRRSLPFDYAVRNLVRRPLRTLLTGASSSLVAALFVATAAFVQGLSTSFSNAGRDDVAILLSRVSNSDVLRSTVPPSLAELVAAEIAGVARPGGVPAVSPEIHSGTNLRLGAQPPEGTPDPSYPAFVRGVTERAFLVHNAVTLIEGHLPGPSEVLVGRIVPDQLGLDPARFRLGETLRFEGGTFTIVGTFAAPGTTIESEIFAPLTDLRSLSRREDSSAVFVRLKSPADFGELELFARRRLDLELNAIPSALYYQELGAYFGPIRALAWVLALMMGGAALFGGANTLNAAVQDRVRELATLRAIGYRSRALAWSLLQESLVLAAAGGLLGLALARFALSGAAVRIAMGAFTLAIGPTAVLAGFGAALFLGLVATLPAVARVARLPVAVALKEP